MKSKRLLNVFVLAVSFCFAAPNAYTGTNNQTDCPINSGPCVRAIEHEGVKVVFDINPKPVSPMKELVFTVTLTDSKGPVADASVSVDLTMPGMFMGINRPDLTHTGGGEYEGRGVIQACPHGGKIWRAEVMITRQGRTASESFTFGVK